MPNEQKDPVKEARELLSRVTLPAEVNAVGRELLPKLCDEIEAHRKHLEFCFHNHVMESELTLLREQLAGVVQSTQNVLETCLDADDPNPMNTNGGLHDLAYVVAVKLGNLESQLAQVVKEQYEPCVTCACGRPSWHRKGDEPL